MNLATRLTLALLLITTTAEAQAPDPWIGKRVFTQYGVVLKIEKTVVDDEKRSVNLAISGKERAVQRIYNVEHVKGEWLWLKDEKSGVAGWVRSKWVIPYDQAIDFYTRKILANPTSENYCTRAGIWLEKGEQDIAIADYNEAIRLDPLSETAYCGRGLVWDRKKEYDRAIADYDEAIRLDPNYASTYYNRGIAWSHKEKYNRAIADYCEAIRLDPKDASVYIGRGLAWYDQKNHDRAIADYDEAIRLDPNYALAYYNRGLAWSHQKEYDRSIADYCEAVRLDPKDASAYIGRGLAWDNKKDHDRAIADYGEAIRLDPKDASAYQNRGRAWAYKKDFDRAITDCAEAIRLDPKSHAGYNSLAWICATCPDPKFRNGKRAIESATKACELTGWNEPNDLDTLAASYAEVGDFDQAVRWVETAIQLVPTNSVDSLKGFGERLALYKNKKPYH